MGPQERLNQYLKEVKNKPFKWGEHDCLTFTNEAWHRMYGFGWADDWLGRYLKQTEYGTRVLQQDEIKQEFGYFDLFKAIDDKLKPISHIPPTGSLVVTNKCERFVTGYAFGISNGIKAAFLNHYGLIYLPLDDVKKAWVN